MLRKRWFVPLAVAACVHAWPAAATPADAPDRGEKPLSVEQTGVRQASDAFYAALNAMFTGDVGPMLNVWSHSDEVTDMGPFGNRHVGWEAVREEFEKEAALKLGGHIECRDPLVRAGTDMGYTLCVEYGTNKDASARSIKVDHRATNIFRLENGKWKLVHHHTDPAPGLERAAKHR